MLRANRKLLRPGGRVACLIIEVAAGLEARLRRRANMLGPRCIATSSTYPSMFGSAGFVDVDRIDATEQYRRTAADWLAQRERFADELRPLMGADAHDEKIRESRETVAAIDQGLLRRYLYVAARRG